MNTFFPNIYVKIKYPSKTPEDISIFGQIKNLTIQPTLLETQLNYEIVQFKLTENILDENMSIYAVDSVG